MTEVRRLYCLQARTLNQAIRDTGLSGPGVLLKDHLTEEFFFLPETEMESLIPLEAETLEQAFKETQDWEDGATVLQEMMNKPQRDEFLFGEDWKQQEENNG